MKTILKICFAGALAGAICAGFAACGGANSTRDSEKTARFFDDALPSPSGRYSEHFFVDDRKNRCVVINSAEELKALMNPSFTGDLPAMDFDKHSLVIGQLLVPTKGYALMDQSLDVGADRITLNLTVEVPPGVRYPFGELYYWSIHPKLPTMPLDVNVTWRPLPDPEDIEGFFERYLPPVMIHKSPCFFVADWESKCLAIDSVEEFEAALDFGVDVMPAIDFDKHTLIIGQERQMSSNYSMKGVELDTGTHPATVILTIELPVDGALNPPGMQYYWMLAPKLSEDPVVRVVFDHVNEASFQTGAY
jgi:hypothetical protein